MQHDRGQHLQQDQRKSALRRFAPLLVLLVVLLGLFALYRYIAGKYFSDHGVLQGSPLGLLQHQPLRVDRYGRTNILVLGTSEIDHPGAELTDTIMLVSLRTTEDGAYLLSIPRDLYIDFGRSCDGASRGRINALYACGASAGEPLAGVKALSAKVDEIFGIEVNYYVHLNWNVIRDAVNAVDGIQMKIESADPRGVLDRNFDWQCGMNCYMVKYKKDEIAHLDGAHALALARARNSHGGYGLGDGDFSRQRNQQRIAVALRDKARSNGLLTNLPMIAGLIEALGDNLKSDLHTSELQALLDYSRRVSDRNIRRLDLGNRQQPLLWPETIDGMMIVRPLAGRYDYSQLRSFVATQLGFTAAAGDAKP